VIELGLGRIAGDHPAKARRERDGELTTAAADIPSQVVAGAAVRQDADQLGRIVRAKRGLARGERGEVVGKPGHGASMRHPRRASRRWQHAS
jgi:hypothetical protein